MSFNGNPNTLNSIFKNVSLLHISAYCLKKRLH